MEKPQGINLIFHDISVWCDPSKHRVLPAITQYSPGVGRSQSRGRSCRLLCCGDPPEDGKVTRRTEDGNGLRLLEFRRVELNVSWNLGKLNTLLVELYNYWTI